MVDMDTFNWLVLDGIRNLFLLGKNPNALFIKIKLMSNISIWKQIYRKNYIPNDKNMPSLYLLNFQS